MTGRGRIIAALAGVLAAPAAAQDFQVQPVFDMGTITVNAGLYHSELAARAMAGDRAARRIVGSGGPSGAAARGSTTARSSLAPGRAAASPRGGTTAAGQAVRLDYVPTLALRRQATADYVARINRHNPAAAQVLGQQLAQHDYGMIFRDQVKGSVLRDDDAADAVTFYTLIGWQIANRDETQISDATIAAVRRQVAAGLAADPRLASPAGRAALGEEMKLLAITLQAGWQGAVKEGNVRRYSDVVAAMWQQQAGRDLRAVRLTDAGFAQR